MMNSLLKSKATARGTIMTKAAMRAGERLNIPGSKMARMLGVSEAQISRLKSGEASLNEKSKPFELAALFVRAFRSLDAICGGNEDVARAWMTSENIALGARPIDSITSLKGLVDVVTYLDARRAPL